MGEYGYYHNNLVKLGTCENMYYLRYEDRDKIEPENNSLDPAYTTNLRFRLPFPDEDHIQPGQYHNYDRGMYFEMINDPCQKCNSISFNMPRVKLTRQHKLVPFYECNNCGAAYSWAWNEIWPYISHFDPKLLERLCKYKLTSTDALQSL